MKRFLAVILGFILCFCFVGCGKGNIEKQNEQAKEVLMKVLEKEQTFTAKTSVVSDKTTEQTLEKYHFQTVDNAYYSFIPEQYAFIDMDNDNIDELVIFDMKMTYHLILHYENEKTYGYNISARSLINLKTDGSFMTSSGAGINSIGNICFDGSEYKIIDKFIVNDNDKEYYIDGKKTDQKTAKAYFDDWSENTPNVDWVKIEEKFLGEQGEELPDGSILYKEATLSNDVVVEFKDDKGNILIDNSDIVKVYVKFSENSNYYIEFEFTENGQSKFKLATEENVGKVIIISADDEVLSSPTIMEVINSGNVIIVNNQSLDELMTLFNKITK